jgi:hypothetical protein
MVYEFYIFKRFLKIVLNMIFRLMGSKKILNINRFTFIPENKIQYLIMIELNQMLSELVI